MASNFTYTGAVDTDLEKVRLLIGDVIESKSKLADSEINFFLTEEGSVRRAAAKSAESISAMFAAKVDQSVGKIRISFSQQFKQFKELASRLTRDANQASLAGAYSGGISKADKAIDQQNEDYPNNFFTRRLNDTPGVSVTPGDNLQDGV